MINALIENCKFKVEEKIDELLPVSDNTFSSLENAVRYSILSGGKRIRPFILTEFYKLCNGKNENVYNFAVALEMIHTYSLIHDDLPCMDNDDFRRGKPSCHKVFGEDIALLAGDALLTAAFTVAATATGFENDKVIRAIKVLSEKAGIGGMIKGQVIDISIVGKSPDAEILTAMYLKKTGCLLEAAAEIGCILAGADQKTINNATVYAQNLGLAFQVIDDILDTTGDEQVLGKPIGSDEKNNKTTFVTLHGIEKSREFADEFTDKALEALDKFEGDNSVLKELTEYLLIRKN